MAITLHPPIGISYIGGRNYNDDTIFPLMGKASVEDTLFLVCDGVGGNATGDVASSLACHKVKEYIDTHSDEMINADFFQQALLYIYESFCIFELEYPASKGMATTLTLLYIKDSTVWLVHLGDSRIYHIRNAAILHKTKDHSFVASLLEAGIISEDEARKHPQKNVIARAIQSQEIKKIDPDVHCITDVCAGDYFFLCTDGIIESITDTQLVAILSNERVPNQAKMQEIFRICGASSKDNFSCYLIQIETGTTENIATQNTEIMDTSAFVGVIDSEEVEF